MFLKGIHFKGLEEVFVSYLSMKPRHLHLEQSKVKICEKRINLHQPHLIKRNRLSLTFLPQNQSNIFAIICRALIHIGDSTHSFFDKVKDSLRQSIVCRRIWKLEQSFNHSNNIFVFFLRSIVDRLKNRLSFMFRESEQAKCILAFRSVAPSFSVESFLRDCREFIIPDVIELFLNNDLLRLKAWTSESTYNILKANLNAMKKPGCVLDGQLFDLRNVDMVGLKMLEDKPVIIVSFQTQQIMVLRNEKSGELVEGDEEKLERYEYVFAFTMNEFLQLNTAKDKMDGWRIIELAIRKV